MLADGDLAGRLACGGRAPRAGVEVVGPLEVVVPGVEVGLLGARRVLDGHAAAAAAIVA